MGWHNKRYRKIKRNQCKAPRCGLPVFKDGYCNRHQYLADAKKPIPKYKKRRPSKLEAYGFRTQMECFQYVIYNTPRPIICPVSGRDITKVFGEDPSVWVKYCAHVLPKGKYVRWRQNPANILLVDYEVHRLYDQGTESQRIATGWNWQFLYDREIN